MNMTEQFCVPKEDDLLEFFGAEPFERIVDDGYWCYEISDERGVSLRFSFNLYERSVQTSLSFGGALLASVSHEGANTMSIRDGKLQCEFSAAGETTRLTVDTGINLSVVWSSLRK